MSTELPEAGRESADNRVSEMEDLYRGLGGRVFALGLRRLFRGRPAGHRALSRHQSVFATWLPLIFGPVALGVVWAALVPLTWLAIAGFVVGAGLSSCALVFAAAVDATVPPPRRPFCQSSALGAFFPFYRETGLVEVVEDQVWLAQVPLVFHGIQMGARMAIVRVGPEDLLVYSPVLLDEAGQDRVRALGRVRWIVAPNAIHHLYVGPWLETFEGAEAWAAPGLAERRPDLAWAGTITADAELPWDPLVLRTVVMEGHPFHQEVVMLHEPSATLLIADVIENLGHGPETGPAGRFLASLFGMDARPTSPTDLK